MERGFDVIPTLVLVLFSNSRPNFELTGAQPCIDADGIAKFSIYNLSAGSLVGIVTAKVLTVFQIGLQYLTTMDHRMKESFYD